MWNPLIEDAVHGQLLQILAAAENFFSNLHKGTIEQYFERISHLTHVEHCSTGFRRLKPSSLKPKSSGVKNSFTIPHDMSNNA